MGEWDINAINIKNLKLSATAFNQSHSRTSPICRQVLSGRYLLGKAAKMEDEDEVMPKQSKRAQEAMKSAKLKKKKKPGRKPKKSPKKPVARKVSTPKAKIPVKKARRGRK